MFKLHIRAMIFQEYIIIFSLGEQEGMYPAD